MGEGWVEVDGVHVPDVEGGHVAIQLRLIHVLHVAVHPPRHIFIFLSIDGDVVGGDIICLM